MPVTGADHGSGRATHASTGIAGLDEVVNELRLGDNVVWQVDGIDSYRALIAPPFVRRALAEDREVVYFRFGEHPMLLADDLLAQVTVHRVDPSGGFEAFATRIHWLIADRPQTFYVFDCLSELLTWWHSALMVTNFFKVTCPLLFEMDTVAYFALLRGGKHANEAVAGIRETTQLLLDVYTIAGGALYVHPLKVVGGRHSATMFFPHRLTDGKAETVTSSEALARLFAVLAQPGPPADHWRSVVDQCWAALREGPTEQIHARDLLMGVLIGREGPMRELCERHLNLLDLLLITSRLIGVGAIGGKSVGMLVARAILEKDLRFAGRLEGHDSFFLGSDLFYSYIVTNGWWPLWAQHKTQEATTPPPSSCGNSCRPGIFRCGRRSSSPNCWSTSGSRRSSCAPPRCWRTTSAMRSPASTSRSSAPIRGRRRIATPPSRMRCGTSSPARSAWRRWSIG